MQGEGRLWCDCEEIRFSLIQRRILCMSVTPYRPHTPGDRRYTNRSRHSLALANGITGQLQVADPKCSLSSLPPARRPGGPTHLRDLCHTTAVLSRQYLDFFHDIVNHGCTCNIYMYMCMYNMFLILFTLGYLYNSSKQRCMSRPRFARISPCTLTDSGLPHSDRERVQ
jgi:hypothetical protein